MEVRVPMVAPASPQDLHFGGSNTATPYASAPSSPRPLGNPEEYYYCYTSAPSSPAPRFGFTLGVGEQSTADELFDKGRIRPLKGPPPAPRPPKSQRGSGTKTRSSTTETEPKQVSNERGRGRDNLSPVSSRSRSRRESRSLSPPSPSLRGEGAFQKTPSSSTTVKSSGSRKWRLKDLLLFRNASEGRATGRGSRDPLRKYTLLSSSFNKTRPGGDHNTSSFKSLDIINRGGASPGPAMSAHELHYTANRAASEEMKKKTTLPFHRNSLFGCLHFNPAVRSITRGFNTNYFNNGSY